MVMEFLYDKNWTRLLDHTVSVCKTSILTFTFEQFGIKECISYSAVGTMVLILDGSSETVAHAGRKIGLFYKKKNPICDSSR